MYVLPKLKCTRCEHSWVPRRSNPPKTCPRCRSPYWNRDRKRKDFIELHEEKTTKKKS